MRTRTIVVLVAGFALMSSVVTAQFGRRGLYQRRAAFATLQDFDGGYQFCRVVFRQSRNGDGAGWNVDWPRADENLSIRLSELTKTRRSAWTATASPSPARPAHRPELFHCPFIMMTEAGRRVSSTTRKRGSCATTC